jgi:hypothetical protein
MARAGKLPCGCVICEQCRAANALHDACSEKHCMAPLDADLQCIVAAWNVLPSAIKAAILVLAQSQCVSEGLGGCQS